RRGGPHQASDVPRGRVVRALRREQRGAREQGAARADWHAHLRARRPRAARQEVHEDHLARPGGRLMGARIRKGDNVVVISGKDKGKTGKVTRVLVEDNRVVVEGINLVKRHSRPTPRNPSGGIIEREQAIHLSKVMPVDPKTGKGTRVRIKALEGGKK